MKKIIYYAFFLLFISAVNSASAQTGELSPSAKQLKAVVKEGNYDAILAAGKSNDRTLIPYLKTLASKSGSKSLENSAAFKAHVALAELGDEEAIGEILAEVDASDPYMQDSAMKKLSYIKGQKAFAKLYSLLDDFAERADPNVKSGVVYFPRASMAVLFLSQMVENPPTAIGVYGTRENVELWKAWFEKNKHLLEQ
jgi:HEAT repeat protein